MPPLIVTAAVIRKNEHILITRRPDGSAHAGLWEFPGGKLHDDETPEQGLAREIREELGLEIEVGEIFKVVHHGYDWGAVLLLTYLCRPLPGKIENLQVAEHRWVAPAELPQFPFLAADGPIIAKLLTSG